MFQYEYSDPHPRAAFTSAGKFAAGVIAAGLLAALRNGESVTITRVPDVFYVPVKIVTANGGLTRRTYTYTHSDLLPAGAVVEVPTPRWAHGPTFGVVQSAGLVDEAAATEPIVRVL